MKLFGKLIASTKENISFALCLAIRILIDELFLSGGAFFAFHLLLAYLVDHISIHLAFVTCSVVSIFLVISYLHLVIGMRFAALEAGTAQLIYLVPFSYAFFFKGFTGLAITIGAIITLFVRCRPREGLNGPRSSGAMRQRHCQRDDVVCGTACGSG
jgi:hypothetical protein